jgi:zinc/manganese transport system substrate-binding protein
LAACQSGGPANGSGTPKVVATHSVLGDIVQNVGREHIDLRTLVGPDGDVHTFEPSPADSATLASAALVFENGLELETWLDKLYDASGSRAERVVVTAGIAPLFLIEDGKREPDPHVWHDVSHAMLMTRVVRDALIAADPPGASAYTQNATEYLAELQALDTWVRETTGRLPAERRKLVTSHDTFGYFAARYGFQVVGAALASFSTEAAEPSAGDLARLAREIRAVGIPVIFAENVTNPRLMERVAEEAGVKLGPPLYTDALGKSGSTGDTYVKMIRSNVTALTTALGQ